MHRTLAEAIDAIAEGIRASNRPEDRALANQYLAALAPLLASAVLGKDILGELPKIERLFGHSWLTDEKPFVKGLEKWRSFREQYEAFALSAMTVNERLAALGRLDDFDRARGAGDTTEMERLLLEARVDAASIRKIIEEL